MELLYLTHRLPFPPDKGDKIRTYNLLRQMAERWTVSLGSFIDDPKDWQYADEVRAMCAETHLVSLSPWLSKARSLAGLFTSEPLTMPYYRNASMRSWVVDVVDRRGIDCAMAFSSSMAQYLSLVPSESASRIVDFCDVDSEKWRQYGSSMRGISRWVYSREGRELQKAEADIGAANDALIFISAEEAQLYCKNTGMPKSNVHVVGNGVDTEFFDPGIRCESPFSGAGENIVFVGAMDYWPNVDAVVWFADEVMPSVRSRFPDASFWIVGSKPERQVAALAKRPGISVTGRVEDVRPYIQYANCVVAPLRVARGVQNKVLEAMAMARPIVVTPEALEGLAVSDVSGVSVCSTSDEWAQEICTTLSGHDARHSVEEMRRKILADYSWSSSGRHLASVIDSVSPDIAVMKDGSR